MPVGGTHPQMTNKQTLNTMTALLLFPIIFSFISIFGNMASVPRLSGFLSYARHTWDRDVWHPNVNTYTQLATSQHHQSLSNPQDHNHVPTTSSQHQSSRGYDGVLVRRA